MRLVILLLSILFSMGSFGQNLFDLAIRKIESTKKSVYYTEGVLHHTQGVSGAHLINIRHSYSPQRGYERIVFDFSTSTIPKTYAYISLENKKIFFDFFNASFSQTIPDLRNVHTVAGVDFFSIDDKNFSTEINFKDQAGFEIFYLANPGRLVIDIKK